MSETRKRIERLEDRLQAGPRILPRVVVISGETRADVDRQIKRILAEKLRPGIHFQNVFIIPASFGKARIPAPDLELEEISEESLGAKSDEELNRLLADLRRKAAAEDEGKNG